MIRNVFWADYTYFMISNFWTIWCILNQCGALKKFECARARVFSQKIYFGFLDVNQTVNSDRLYFFILGRLIQASQKQTWGGDFHALSVQDRKKVHELLDKYRKMVEARDICAGDCPNDGVSCQSGVCRAHLR